LLKDEQELVDKVKSVAERRRNLPLGGQSKEGYVFQWDNDGKVGKSVKFSELFAEKDSLLLYSFMYGPNWAAFAIASSAAITVSNGAGDFWLPRHPFRR
jgi:predicted dithiol-disulfide oxidoreductase (DUF899 family)